MSHQLFHIFSSLHLGLESMSHPSGGGESWIWCQVKEDFYLIKNAIFFGQADFF